MQLSLKQLRNCRAARLLAIVLTALFPVCLVFMTEVNQSGSWGTINQLIFEKPTILLFDLGVIVISYGIFGLLFRHIAVSAVLNSVFWYALSCIEFYRFQASGSHFTIYDISVVTNIQDVLKFADIKIYSFQIITLLVLALYCTALFLLGSKISLAKKHVISGGSASLALTILFFFVPGFSSAIFSACGVQYGGMNNNFVQQEKFEQNYMIAFLVENLSDVIQTMRVQEPENYSEESIETLSTDTVMQKEKTMVKPNVITIMSESYADFRIFPDLDLDEYYQNFDYMRNEGYAGDAIVPTFGGYTIRTEFELLFGLPIKSLNGTISPQNMLSLEEQTTAVSYYKSQGYTTTYIHPYTSDLYRRKELYPYYGFDRLYFQDSFLSPNYYHGYIDDQSAFDKAVEQIIVDDKPSYIHITSMQNHMPYGTGEDDQFQYYMDGIKQTDEALGNLIEQLKQFEEPTVVLFVGDHYPSFSGDSDIYDQMGIEAANCRQMYRQKFFVWSNYDFNFKLENQKAVSTFYLPWLLADSIGLPGNDIMELMLEQYQKDPVYTMEYRMDYHNEVLDTLTYDLILGDKYSNYYLR